jgi:hypothetical protein
MVNTMRISDPADGRWRYAVLLVWILGSLVLVLAAAPIPQDPAYHRFVDTRCFAGIPNFLDVISNLPFLVVGIVGLRHCLTSADGPVGRAWTVFFAGVTLVSAGSAYYHWRPSNAALVWDRLPMTVAFAGLFAALLGDYLSPKLALRLLAPLILLGLGSVFYWHWTDDLSLYIWIQFMPLVSVALLLLLFNSPYPRPWLLGVALAWYALAKVFETFDSAVFRVTGETISGHTIKHLLAAAGCATLLFLLNDVARDRSDTVATGLS